MTRFTTTVRTALVVAALATLTACTPFKGSWIGQTPQGGQASLEIARGGVFNGNVEFPDGTATGFAGEWNRDSRHAVRFVVTSGRFLTAAREGISPKYGTGVFNEFIFSSGREELIVSADGVTIEMRRRR